jgi:hypothetical protein
MSVANVSVIAAAARLSPMRGAIRLYERKPGGKSETAPIRKLPRRAYSVREGSFRPIPGAMRRIRVLSFGVGRHS